MKFKIHNIIKHFKNQILKTSILSKKTTLKNIIRIIVAQFYF